MSNFCPHCGTELPENVAFCHVCGASTNADYVENANPYDAGAPNDYAPRYDDGETTVGPSFWGALPYCMANYCNFQGRATRSEYWGWMVANWLIGVAAAFFPGGIAALWNLAATLPAFAVMGRRLHDVGWSAKLMLGPILLGIVGLPFLIFGVGLENLETNDDVVASMEGALVGIALTLASAAWQLVLGITAAFVRGTQGPNRFGPRRLNPSDVGR